MTTIDGTLHFPLSQQTFELWIKESKEGNHTNINEFITKFFTNCPVLLNRFLKHNPEMCLKCVKRERKIAPSARDVYSTCMNLQVFDLLKSEKVSILDKSGVVEVNFNSTLFRLFSGNLEKLLEDKKSESSERRRYQIQLPLTLSHHALLALKEIIYHQTIQDIYTLTLTDFFELIDLLDIIKVPEDAPDLHKHLMELFYDKITVIKEVSDLFSIHERADLRKRFPSVLAGFFKNNNITFLFKDEIFYLPPCQIGLLNGENTAFSSILKRYVKGLLLDVEDDVLEMELLKYLPGEIRQGIESIYYTFDGNTMVNLREFFPNIKTVYYPFNYLNKKYDMPVKYLLNLAQSFGDCDLHFYFDESNPITLAFTYTLGVTDFKSSARIHLPRHVHRVSFSPGLGARLSHPITFAIQLVGYRRLQTPFVEKYSPLPPGLMHNSPPKRTPEVIVLELETLWR